MAFDPNAFGPGFYRGVVGFDIVATTSTGFDVTLSLPPVAPTITLQPTPQSVVSGSTATFTASAPNGTPLATRQWQKFNGSIWVNISGATATNYTTPTLSPADNGSLYRFTDTNSAGFVVSDSTLLTVRSVPAFVSQQTNLSGVPGGVVQLSWAASGVPNPTLKVQRYSAGGGASPLLVQSTPVAAGFYSDAVATFPAPVTATNTIIVLGSFEDGVLTSSLSTGPGDSFTYASQISDASSGGFMARATAVGGSTTITMTGMVRARFIAMEWSGLVFDAAAGTGTAIGTATVTATTPSTTSVASSVSFSVIAFRAGSSFDAQTIATGFTEAGRDTSGGAPFVAGYRTETTISSKSATWVDPVLFPDNRAALIWVFNAAGSPPAWVDVNTGSNFTGPSPLTYTTPTLDVTFNGAEYRAVATNTEGAVNSATAVLTVTSGPLPKLKQWNGSAWVSGTLKQWNGSAWVSGTLKQWNGASWI